MILDIVKGNPDLDGFRFCKKIMTPYSPSIRPHLCHVLISGGYCSSTDGSRAHSFKHDNNYDDGLYLITLCRMNLVQLVKTEYETGIRVERVRRSCRHACDAGQCNTNCKSDTADASGANPQ